MGAGNIASSTAISLTPVYIQMHTLAVHLHFHLRVCAGQQGLQQKN